MGMVCVGVCVWPDTNYTGGYTSRLVQKRTSKWKNENMNFLLQTSINMMTGSIIFVSIRLEPIMATNTRHTNIRSNKKRRKRTNDNGKLDQENSKPTARKKDPIQKNKKHYAGTGGVCVLCVQKIIHEFLQVKQKKRKKCTRQTQDKKTG